MAKRFTDTEIWNKAWFRRLSPRLKEFWRYLCERCDMAGVWECDFETASWFVNQKIDESDLDAFGDKIFRLPDNKVFIPGFIRFQYVELSEDSNAHRGVIKTLTRHGIDYGTLTLKVPLPNSTPTLLGRDKDKDKDKDKDSSLGFQEGGLGETKDVQSGIAQPATTPDAGAKKIFDAWNQNRRHLAEAKAFSKDRKRLARQRWLEKPDPAYWVAIVDRIAQSIFCGGGGATGWKADFDFLIQPDTHLKVLEGKYDNRLQKTATTKSEQISQRNAEMFAAVERGEL